MDIYKESCVRSHCRSDSAPGFDPLNAESSLVLETIQSQKPAIYTKQGVRSYNSADVHMLDFLLASALLFGMPTYALLRGSSTGQAPVDKRKRYRKSMAIIAVFLMILLVDWVSTSRRFTQIGLAAPTTRSAIGGCLVAVFAAIIVFLALTRKSNAKKAAKLDDQADTILPESRDELRSFVIYAIVAGFGWEVLYRGFLLFWLSPLIGLVPAVAASSIAYGLSHGCKTMTQTTGSLVSALLFTTGYAATGSLWWLIILHIALPLVSMLALSRMEHHRLVRDEGKKTSTAKIRV